jgi:CSLREA domain-containing protein
MKVKAYRYSVVLLVVGIVLAGSLWVGRARAATTLTVNSASDGDDSSPGNGSCATANGVCTLRAAIQEANALAGTDTIAFNIGSGNPSITPFAPLPTITAPVIIDGNTGGATRVQLAGTFSGTANGLVLGAGSGGSQIRSLVIRSFSGEGIEIRSNGNTIQNNYIGTDATGTTDQGNTGSGVFVQGANNLIGGTTAGTSNLISGNNGEGVEVNGSAATGNQLQGNFIGTKVNGTERLPNGLGVMINAAANNVVGGTAPGAGNLISGNSQSGVLITLGAAGNRLQGNFIGTDVTGTVGLGNFSHGVQILNSSNNLIGGTDADDGEVDGNVRARNVISGNSQNGLHLSGGDNNKIQGNYIGTDVTGTVDRGNKNNGLNLFSGANTIGGTAAGAGNLISGNDVDGVFVTRNDNKVQGNLIGTDVTGTVALKNGAHGVEIKSINNAPVASNNLVGGTDADDGEVDGNVRARNVISGNGADGVLLFGASDNKVQGNFIGTDATGTADLGNSTSGVNIFFSTGNTIGGAAAGARNLISGNELNGVSITGNTASGNKVQGNFIGTNVTGTAGLGNSSHGVEVIDNALNNVIGGGTGLGNTIAFNGKDGVSIYPKEPNTTVTGNVIFTNSIFSNVGLGIDLNDDGVTHNDPLDPDAGPNNLQNFPVITSVLNNRFSNTTTVQGQLDSTPNKTFTIEFFSSSEADPSGYGEGQTFRGSTAVTTAGSGNAVFTVSLPTAVPAGHLITATATDSANNTSEFSQAFLVPAAPAATFNISGRITNSQGGAGVEGVAVTLTGSRGAVTQTDSQGNYSFADLPADGSYSVTPSKAGFGFTPPTRSFTNPTGNVTADFVATAAATPTPTPPVVQLSQSTYSANEGLNTVGITVTRAGNPNVAVSVELQTVDDPAEVRCDAASSVAFARCDYATTVETVTWAAGDAAPKTVQIPLINDAHPEGAETFRVRLSDPAGGASLGTQSEATVTVNDDGDTASTPNPIAQTQFFVRMHYLDFLSREPEALEPWSAVLNGCPNQFNLDPNSPSALCDRLTVSAAFFGSPEFRMKGLFVFRFYKLSFGRLPLYSEIVPDMRRVAGQTPEEVFAKKARFTDAWVQRQEFKALYDALSNAAFVAALMDRYQLQSITTPDPANPDGEAKVTLTRDDLINRLNSAALTRAQVVRAIADSDEVSAAEFRPAFVAMQYYGYLRRTPESSGYQNWLNYLNAHPTDFRTMVNGFLNSVEYRLRFGRP